MVVKVYGKCNGADLTLTKVQEVGKDTTWTAVIPSVSSGVYVIELTAVDDTGLTAYFATVKMAYDSSLMRYRWEVLDVGANWSLDEVNSVLGGGSRLFGGR